MSVGVKKVKKSRVERERSQAKRSARDIKAKTSINRVHKTKLRRVHKKFVLEPTVESLKAVQSTISRTPSRIWHNNKKKRKLSWYMRYLNARVHAA